MSENSGKKAVKEINCEVQYIQYALLWSHLQHRLLGGAAAGEVGDIPDGAVRLHCQSPDGNRYLLTRQDRGVQHICVLDTNDNKSG